MGGPVRDGGSARQLMAQLYRDHAAALFAFALHYADGDRQRAEDVVQETLLRAWRTWGTLDGHRNPRPYLFTVARNVLTDQWRAARRRPQLVADEVALAAHPSPEVLDGVEDGWLVGDALRRISPEHRAVVHALYYEGRTVAEAARVLGVPEGTVKSRSYYAVRALRAALEGNGVVR